MLHTHDIYEQRARMERNKELRALKRALTRSLANFLHRQPASTDLSRTERNSRLGNDNATSRIKSRAA